MAVAQTNEAYKIAMLNPYPDLFFAAFQCGRTQNKPQTEQRLLAEALIQTVFGQQRFTKNTFWSVFSVSALGQTSISSVEVCERNLTRNSCGTIEVELYSEFF